MKPVLLYKALDVCTIMSDVPVVSSLNEMEGSQPSTDTFSEDWRRKRDNRRLRKTSARNVLHRYGLSSWDGHVKVDAVFHDPCTGELSAGRLIWEKLGDVTTHSGKLLKERCPQEVSVCILAPHHC